MPIQSITAVRVPDQEGRERDAYAITYTPPGGTASFTLNVPCARTEPKRR